MPGDDVSVAGRLRPVAVVLGGRRVPVAEVLDGWLVEDEWWRVPIARHYLRVLLGDGRLLTLFHDRIGGGWYTQRYGNAERGARNAERGTGNAPRYVINGAVGTP